MVFEFGEFSGEEIDLKTIEKRQVNASYKEILQGQIL
jgi:hypothetical protein